MTGQHVRITLEGVAECVPDGQVLRVRMGGSDGPLVLVSKAWPGVSVEDVTPPRTWTDGDVIAEGSDVWARVDGRWLKAGADKRWGASDDTANRTLARYPLATTVLRYQVGE
jgi:hypothetical protein